MLNYDFILLLSGLGLAGLAVYLFLINILSTNTDQSALALASGDDEDSSSGTPPWLKISISLSHNLSMKHAQRIKFKKYRESIASKITYAGLTKVFTVDEFIALQILWGVILPIFLLILNFALQTGYSPFIFAILAGGGAYLPHIYCQGLSNKRATSIDKDLPFFIDLLALSTEAGLDFISAIEKITEKAKNGQVIADEFYILLKELKLGASRNEAFENFTKRIQSKEVKSLITMIQDSNETGSSIAVTLKAKSDQMRYERLNKAEELGAKASQKILIPMMIFIVPAVLITVFAPIAIQFYYGGGN